MPTTLRTVLLFPGQGSQTPDMRDLVEAERPDLLELATEIVRDDPFAERDRGTQFLQPAIYCASLASLHRHGDFGADVMAGHSLGEITALVAAGCLEDEDGLRLVAKRGELMDEAAAHAGDGGMLALLAAKEGGLQELLAGFDVEVAAYNSPGQVVVSGPSEELRRLAHRAREEGVRSVRLRIRGAFHSRWMSDAATDFAEVLATVAFHPPRVPVLSSISAAVFVDPRRELAAALTRPVRWRQLVTQLGGEGQTRFVEIGPGRVLSGLVRHTLYAVDAYSVEEREAVYA